MTSRGTSFAAGVSLALVCSLAAFAEERSGLSGARDELRGVEWKIDAAAEERRRIEAEIAALDKERAELANALIGSTARTQEIERRALEAEMRLEASSGEEEARAKALEDRRALTGEILLVLQRMGRRPPPALLARPEDILAAIRSSLLLGSMLPRMRAELHTLEADLSALVALRAKIKAERIDLDRELESLNAERARLQALIEGRQKALSLARNALGMEQERAHKLALEATSLKDLIARMERELESSRRAAEAARQAEEARAAADAAAREKARAAPFKDAARLAPAAAFAELKGRLPIPAMGAIVKRYGAPDGQGSTEKGVSLAVRENGIVAAPCDGWVAFSGKYRSYGQLLIINAGNGYYVVLAGMGHINVNAGQFVLAGEPVASMGDGAVRTAAAVAIGAKQPILYIEFRKDGTSIDPAPWWAKPDVQKVDG